MNPQQQGGLKARLAQIPADMEAESRTWMVQCPHCGYERSMWDMGGLMYKAVGTSWKWRRCPHCGRMGWHKVYRRQAGAAAGPAGADTVPLAPTVGPAGAAAGPGASAEVGRRLRRLLVFIVGLWVVLVLLIGGFVLGLVSGLTEPVVTTGDAFLTAVRAAEYDRAYALCTPDLQGTLGGAGGLAGAWAGHPLGAWHWTGRSVRNGVGQLDGPFTYADGRPGTAHLTLFQVHGAWRVAAFQFIPSGGP